MIKVIKNNKFLLGQLVKKDIEQRYKGSVLGILWTIIVPILMLVIYTFVFSEIFQAKWSLDTSDKYEFALVLFCGLTSFNMVSEVMNRSTNLIASNTNYVKKVVFPLELLPLVITLSALFTCVISFIILIVAKLVLYHDISPTLYQSILVFLPLILICIGVAYILSAISVYLKDIGNVINVLVMVLMYMSPVFFPLTSVPEKYRGICMVNPMTYIIENFRNTMLYGVNLDWSFLLLSVIIAVVIYALGYFVFMRTKEGFADVL